MQQSFTPSAKTLEKYAELIVRFGLRAKTGGKLKPGSVVQYIVPEAAKPLYFHLQRAILKAGFQPIGTYKPSWEEGYNLEEDFYLHATKKQLDFSPEIQAKGTIDQIDGVIHILAETNPNALKDINPKKVLQRSQAQKKAVAYKRKKIEAEKLYWTIALYGTDAMAAEAGMTLPEYWKQIERACYLEKQTPVDEWEKINKTVQSTAKKLTALKIESLHVVGEDIDLTLGIGANRQWLAGGGCNIPSFEVFTTPHWQSVTGWAR